jgi:hypothetical protein
MPDILPARSKPPGDDLEYGHDLRYEFARYANWTDETTSVLDERVTALEELIASLSLRVLLRLRRRLRNSVRIYGEFGPAWTDMRAQAVSDERSRRYR